MKRGTKQEYVYCIAGLADKCDNFEILDFVYELLKGAVYHEVK